MNFLFIISFLFLVGAGAIGYFLAWPAYQSFHGLQAQVSQEEQTLEQKKKVLGGLQDVHNELATQSEKVKKIKASLPEEPFAIPLYIDVVQLAADSKMTIMDLSGGVPAEQQGGGSSIKTTVFTVGLAGTYDQFQGFIKQVESFPRALNIKNIQVGSAEEVPAGEGAAPEGKTEDPFVAFLREEKAQNVKVSSSSNPDTARLLFLVTIEAYSY
ncbi:MAG: hypothetical protein A3E07_00990 [Candidatus Wildermuthbacteria bacterium RIFCSPHIGHO2_12_FULL_45_9]|uniref:Pilus assembly protein PilO n=1 Tax=Candidatus Wildermuthbacteria bacterium RIFCSPHIGHO2_02_FULL_45_25 TaxID=1802450 RepID=A0A1G2R158_9BACT|nr:MAG: hypothetical protein A2748_03370 [Candidatus Wildermuthbacteria bacterium RIFCSPHIGHO2_01_FULL_45_20]OHA66615.1 MAG: hypothetical protein A3C04_00465 [Candidatus Wildermuthbacteria bacterium RIFCSPHIGHO2_02_FULL_45_25]OHA71516.1 MAG: hypothetical protein A3E07_00990 [Candidatus Wildermuthbacteria bacterium RIFCSPHIGHO2_12_FULL_45_9]